MFENVINYAPIKKATSFYVAWAVLKTINYIYVCFSVLNLTLVFC